MTWHQHAACHPDRRPPGWTHAEWTAWWFPPQAPGGRRQVEQLAATCASCPVLADCRTETAGLAASGVPDHGFRAGLRQEERTRARSGDRPRRSSDLTDDQVDHIRALTDAGMSVTEIAAQAGVGYGTAWRWRARFLEEQVA